jgi:hypothetical protein
MRKVRLFKLTFVYHQFMGSDRRVALSFDLPKYLLGIVEVNSIIFVIVHNIL